MKSQGTFFSPDAERNFALEQYGEGSKCFDHSQEMWEERSCGQVIKKHSPLLFYVWNTCRLFLKNCVFPKNLNIMPPPSWPAIGCDWLSESSQPMEFDCTPLLHNAEGKGRREEGRR